MICTDAMTGLGTATMSVWQPSGDDGQRRHHQSACLVAHVAADGNGVIRLAEVHGRMLAADVAVAEQTCPASEKLVAVSRGIVGQFPDVTKLVAQFRPPFSLCSAAPG